MSLNAADENRHIAFEGIHNFRDIGGYTTADGRTVKWGMVYRSGHLASHTQADLEKLQQLKIKTIVDFRSLGEVEQHPDPAIEGTRYIHSPAVAEGQIDADMRSISRMDGENMKTFYTDIPINNDAFRQLFQLLLHQDTAPLLMHCTGGKDRTGGAAALILLTLGVPVETVIEDYLLTNIYLKDFSEQVLAMYRPMLSDEELKNMELMLSARPEFIDSTLKKIYDVYGDFDTYLVKDLGIDSEDQQRLKYLYLD